MTRNTHLASSALILPLLASLPPAAVGPWVTGTVIGVIAPDSDFPFGNPVQASLKEIRRKVRSLGIIAGLFSSVLLPAHLIGYAVGWILKTICSVFGLPHRGILHTPTWGLMMLVAGSGIWLFSPGAGGFLLGMGTGWILHLALDSLTPSGIRWFGKKISGPIVTGGPGDTIVRWLMIALGVLSLLARYAG
ncbi:metal-dependent hydrolase [Thermogutta sp.]|uniref:metal-dependent hydrolase n=1 Tax=Thermogutta sp. TaxID=1962930 RepID=UPI00321FCE0B